MATFGLLLHCQSTMPGVLQVFLLFLFRVTPTNAFKGGIGAMEGGPWPKYAIWGGGIIGAWTYSTGGGGAIS